MSPFLICFFSERGKIRIVSGLYLSIDHDEWFTREGDPFFTHRADGEFEMVCFSEKILHIFSDIALEGWLEDEWSVFFVLGGVRNRLCDFHGGSRICVHQRGEILFFLVSRLVRAYLSYHTIFLIGSDSCPNRSDLWS